MTQDERSLRRWWWAAGALIAGLAAGRLWWIPAHASHKINEGWNAGHVARAFGPGSLYPPPDALIANNYPPLSFLVVGLFDRFVGDALVSGRIVALLSEAAVGAAIYVVILRLARSQSWATTGALLFAVFAVTLLRTYLAINDPQWLGQALMAWALVLLIPTEAGARLSSTRVIAAAVLTVAGALVKHNLVALPIAATLWLFLIDRRAMWTWVAAGALLTATACAGLFSIWGTAVFADVLAPARSYSGLRMAAHGSALLVFVLPGILAARPLLERWREDPRRLLPLLLLAVAVPTAVLQRSGDGVDINATFETVIALAIVVPLGCSLRRERAGRWFALAALPTILLIPVALLADVREIIGRDAEVRGWQPFIARIASTPGPVACDDQALCHWAGRTSAVDFFAIKQRLLKGDVPPFRTALDRHDFALIEMRSENPGWHENRIIPEIRARYRTIYIARGTELRVPK